MSDSDKPHDDCESYAQEVAELGKQAFADIFSYIESDCVNLHHGDGALPPHSVIGDALRELADRIEVWDGPKTDKNAMKLNRYRPPHIKIISELEQVILDDFAKSMPSTFDRTKVGMQIGVGTTHLVSAVFNYFRHSKGTLLMFAPCYTLFLQCCWNVGDNVHLIRPTSDGQITPEHIERALNEHPETNAIFLINPNNPTGQYFTKDELEKIGRLAIERQLFIIMDEIMHRLFFDYENRFVSMASIEIDGKCMIERTITFRGLSKDHGLASVRSGYAIGSKELIEKFNFTSFLFLTTCNVDMLAQYVTIVALSRTPDEYYQAQRDLLQRHVNIVINFVEDINGKTGYESLKAERPRAGMFQIIDASSLRGRVYNGNIINTDVTLCKLLLNKGMGGVSFLPASASGYNPNDMKFRLTLSSCENDINLGMKRLDDFIQKLSPSDCKPVFSETSSSKDA